LLLTDGQPTDSPLGGEDSALKEYFDTNPKFKCQINTYGFGYSLNSKLLLNLAVLGDGVFGFIPDAKIVGTCFVSAVANFCSTLSQNCNVHLKCCNGSSFADGFDNPIKLNPIQLGQHRDLIVPMKNIQPNGDDIYLEIRLEYQNDEGAWRKFDCNASSRTPTGGSMSSFVRNKVINQVNKIVEDSLNGKYSQAVDNMKVLEKEVATLELSVKDPDNECAISEVKNLYNERAISEIKKNLNNGCAISEIKEDEIKKDLNDGCAISEIKKRCEWSYSLRN